MELRPYQAEAVKAIEGEWDEGRNRTLLVLPTGAGKTVVFATLVKREIERGGRCLVLAHRGELLTQAMAKIGAVAGVDCDLEQAGNRAMLHNRQCVVASMQTLAQESRLTKWDRRDFSLVIIDEAHHILSGTYRKIIDYFQSARLLGVTATPDRGDKKSLSDIFDSVAYEYTLPQAIEDGYLCHITVKMIPILIDMTAAHIKMGDYSDGELGSIIEPYLDEIAAHMETVCRSRKTVVFLPLIATAVKMCEILNNHGFKAVEVDGSTVDRASVIAAFERGEYDVICNAMLLTEGWDCPAVDCVVPLRPTQVRALYCQMVGRGTRVHPGKNNLLLLDFMYNTARYSLVRPADITVGNREIADAMTLKMSDGGEYDLDDVERNVIAERESKLLEKVREASSILRNKVIVLEDAAIFGFCTNELEDYEPIMRWERELPSEKQIAMLERNGITVPDSATRGQCSKMIDVIIKRRGLGLSSFKQIKLLKTKGYTNVERWTFEEASSEIDAIASHGWKPRNGAAVFVPPSLREEVSAVV